ncbi:hypothetical protein LEMLEM_LOCUS816, partial [Lemmus lemmus]
MTSCSRLCPAEPSHVACPQDHPQVSFSKSSSFVTSFTFITSLLARFPNEVTGLLKQPTY